MRVQLQEMLPQFPSKKNQVAVEEQQFQSFVSCGDGAAVVTLKSMNCDLRVERGFVEENFT
jgi:hypothetical protein